MADGTNAIRGDNSLYTGATTGAPTPQHGQRRRHNFGDRVYKLSPEETPFFAYLSAVAKMPTDDPVFRVLEDRAPIKWADRTFAIEADTSDITIPTTLGDPWKDAADNEELPLVTAADSDELVPGMLVQAILYGNVGAGGNDSSEQPEQVTALITEVPTGKVKLQGVSSGVAGAGATTIGSGNIEFQVIGTAFGEGTGAPESFGYDIEDTLGYTQIFKTSASMTNTARATVLRGYANEWDRIWSMKLREHKVDIERAFLFNNKGRVDSIQYTDGIIGKIIKAGGTWGTADGTALAYASNTSYCRVVDVQGGGTDNEAVYDRFLKDFEVIFAPERGGASSKFCMASLPVVTYFNQLKNGFMADSLGSGSTLNFNMAQVEGGLGHKVMKMDTVHGSLSIVKNPLLKGIAKSMMVGVDLGNVKYRPLVGNGLNRDTYVETNVQKPDLDARLDQIITEAGLEICMPESHFLYQFVDAGVPIG